MVLDGRPPPISNSEKELTRKERSTIAQLRSGYCRLLGSYKSRIKKDINLDVCADCGTTLHDVKHLFVCPAHPTTLIPSDLWSRPTDAVRELSYLEARDPYLNEHGLKGVQQQAGANDTSGELGSAFPGSLVGESVFRTAKLEILIESASWLLLVSVVPPPECQSEL